MNSLNFARRDNYKIPLDKGGKGDFQAFTLVELIVVVTILAIL
ncbi:MAG: prepilin-type N-terminal cleavage/methylation domain-containing protein [Candidatus Peribacteria bacterium]|jgi:prepilin-type N-terminal cleavage/methylation domain-containing protein|nr:prepilin-type N-terminal cleavage/methylation domain-containing protein [Candidatus Peribacteria bacterium]